MIFAPHTLQIKVVVPPEEDEYGKIVPGTGGESWKDLGRCRCDDISADKKVSANGSLYDYKFKVVYESVEAIEAGVSVRCLNADGSVRGEGVARNPMQANYFLCRVVWLE